jgi:hypothetical protein
MRKQPEEVAKTSDASVVVFSYLRPVCASSVAAPEAVVGRHKIPVYVSRHVG